MSFSVLGHAWIRAEPQTANTLGGHGTVCQGGDGGRSLPARSAPAALLTARTEPCSTPSRFSSDRISFGALLSTLLQQLGEGEEPVT